MSKSAQATTGRVKAFQKPATTREGGSFTSLVLTAAGALTCAVAVVTALPTAPHPMVETLAEALGRAGLDKGPIFLSGLFLAAIGVLAGQVQRAARGAGQGDETSEAVDALAGDVEAVSAILAAVQGELSAIRADSSELRRRADAEERAKAGNGEGSDPMFRLAASLDQLGATIGKRVEAVRGEMLQAVEAVRERVSATQDHEEAMRAEREQAKEFEALRLDLADIAGRFKTIESELGRITGSAAPAADGESGEAPGEVHGGADASVESAEVEPPLPRELSEESAASAPAFPPAPMTQPMKSSPAPELASEDEAPAPPPPIPRPSEGLQLIDDMDEDTARASDVTPPLFPDIDSGGPGAA